MSRAEELRMAQMRQAPAAPAPAPARNRRTVARPQPQIGQAPSQPFNWAQEYGNRVTSTNENFLPRSVVGTEGGLYADDIVNSTRSISGGEGGIFDYLTVGLAPLALAGFGAAKGARAVDSAATSAILKRILENPDISIVAPRSAMPEILSSRFKGQRELMSEQPGFDPTKFGRREQVEADLLGYPLSTPDAARPIYGAVANRTQLPEWLLRKAPGRAGDTLRLFDPRANMSGMFGLNNAVITRVPAKKVEGTFTVGDSWLADTFARKAVDLKSLNTPSSRREIAEAIARARAERQPSQLGYIEAQMSPSKNPVDAIRQIDVPPSYEDVWAAAWRRAYPLAEEGEKAYDPIIRSMPRVIPQTRSSTSEFINELYNNPVRPKLPVREMDRILLSEADAARRMRGQTFGWDKIDAPEA